VTEPSRDIQREAIGKVYEAITGLPNDLRLEVYEYLIVVLATWAANRKQRKDGATS
jgi:hypothetical protein